MTLAVSVFVGGVWVDGGSPRSAILTTPFVSTETGELSPGSLELVMGNQDRKWDPDYASSPLAGLNVGVPIRAIESVTGVQMFRGTIDELFMFHDGTANSVTEVTAIDLNEQLAQVDLPSAASYWAGALRGGTHIPLDDKEEGLPVASSRNTITPASVGTLAGLPRSEQVVAAGGGPGGRSWDFTAAGMHLPTHFTNPDWGIGFWFACSTTGNIIIVQPIDQLFVGTDSSGDYRIRCNAGAILFEQAGNGGLLVQFVSGSTAFADGSLHHLYVTVDSGLQIAMSVDGVLLTPVVNTNPTAGKAPSAMPHVIGFDAAAPKGLKFTVGHIVQHLAGYAPLEMYRAGRYGAVRSDFAGAGITFDTPAKRIEWCYARAGIALGSIAGGSVLIGPMGGSLTASKAIAQAAASEGGIAWVDGAGNGRYEIPSATVALTLTESQILRPINTSRSRARRITDVKVTGIAGIEAYASTGALPKRTVEIDSLLTTQANAQTLATAVLTKRQAVATGLPSVRYLPVQTGTTAATVALKPGSMVRTTHKPAKLGTAITIDSPMEKAVHTWLPGEEWVTELTLGVF